MASTGQTKAKKDSSKEESSKQGNDKQNKRLRVNTNYQISDDPNHLFPNLKTGNIPPANPLFAIHDAPLFVDHNPLSDVEILADSTVNIPPESPGRRLRSSAVQNTKDDIKNLALKMSADLGFALPKPILEDLYVLFAKEKLDEKLMYAYLRGASRASQVVITTSFTKAMESVEALLAKNNQVMNLTSETTKVTNERLAVMSKHIEALPSQFSAIVKNEHAVTREKLEPMSAEKEAIRNVASAGNIQTVVPNAFPGIEELKMALKQVKCPTDKLENYSTQIEGKVTWDQYNSIMSGKMNTTQGGKLLNELRKQAARST